LIALDASWLHLNDLDGLLDGLPHQVIKLEAAIKTRQLLARGDNTLTTETCGNCWDDVIAANTVSLCSGRCGFIFCRSCAAKTYDGL